MDIIHFLGRSMPSGFNLTLSQELSFRWHHSVVGITALITLNMKNSDIDIRFDTETFKEEDYAHYLVRATDLARDAVDLVAFAGGLAATSVLETFVWPNGKTEQLTPHDDRLRAVCTSFNLTDNYPAVLNLVSQDFELAMALRDLIDALSISHLAPINCGRVLDGIKRMISPNTKNPKAAWRAMQAALNISPEYQRWITDISANPRHADRSYISAPATNELLKRTWTIMNRFIEYRKRANAPLTAPEFPILSP